MRLVVALLSERRYKKRTPIATVRPVASVAVRWLARRDGWLNFVGILSKSCCPNIAVIPCLWSGTGNPNANSIPGYRLLRLRQGFFQRQPLDVRDIEQLGRACFVDSAVNHFHPATAELGSACSVRVPSATAQMDLSVLNTGCCDEFALRVSVLEESSPPMQYRASLSAPFSSEACTK